MWQLKKDPNNPNEVHLYQGDKLVHGEPENLYNAIGYKSAVLADYLKNGNGMIGKICMDLKYAAVRGYDGKFNLNTIQAFVSGKEGRLLTQWVKKIDPHAEMVVYGTVDKTRNILGYAEQPHINGHEKDYPFITRAEAERLYATNSPVTSGLHFHGKYPRL